MKLVFSQILRSMLYRGSEIMREVAWVVFDEIHYMRDSGVCTQYRQYCTPPPNLKNTLENSFITPIFHRSIVM